MARACFTLLQEGGLQLVQRNDSPCCPRENCANPPSYEVHHQRTDLKSQTGHISEHLQNITIHSKRQREAAVLGRMMQNRVTHILSGHTHHQGLCYDTLADGTRFHTCSVRCQTRQTQVLTKLILLNAAFCFKLPNLAISDLLPNGFD